MEEGRRGSTYCADKWPLIRELHKNNAVQHLLYDRGRLWEAGIEFAGRTAIRLHTDRRGGTTVKSD